jgi:hypothetical protein
MTANDIACRRCASQPKEKCLDIDIFENVVELDYFHAERIEDAALWTTPTNQIGEQEFDEALSDTGLI